MTDDDFTIRSVGGRIYIIPEEQDEAYEAHVNQAVQDIIKKVSSDIAHHFEKFGHQRLDDGNWLKVIVEEEGEAVAAINKEDWPEAKKELMQVIACWMRLYAEVERMEQGINEQERELYGRAN